MYIYCTNTQELTRQQKISPSKCSVIQFRYPCLDNGSDLYGKKIYDAVFQCGVATGS